MGTASSRNSRNYSKQECPRVRIVDPRGDPGCNDIVQSLNIGQIIAKADSDVGRKYLFEMDLSTTSNSDSCSNGTPKTFDTTPFEPSPVAPPPSSPVITPASCKNKMEQKSVRELGRVPADWSSPCPNSTLGVFQLDNGQYILSMLIHQYGEDQRLWRQWLRRIERTMRGLEKSCKCRITLYDKPFRFRGVLTHMIRIRGMSKKSVIRCKNALPPHVQDMLITAREYY